MGHEEQLHVRDILSKSDNSKKLWPVQRLLQCVQCDLEDTTMGQIHDTSLGHEKQLCEIISKSNIK